MTTQVRVARKAAYSCPACDGLSTCDFRSLAEKFCDTDSPPDPAELPPGFASAAAVVKRCSAPLTPSPGLILSSLGIVAGIAAAYPVETAFHSLFLSGTTFLAIQILGYWLWHTFLAKAAFERYRVAAAAWPRSMLCLQCGNAFEVDDT